MKIGPLLSLRFPVNLKTILLGGNQITPFLGKVNITFLTYPIKISKLESSHVPLPTFILTHTKLPLIVLVNLTPLTNARLITILRLSWVFFFFIKIISKCHKLFLFEHYHFIYRQIGRCVCESLDAG